MFIKFIKKINLFFKILLSQNYYFETCKSQNDNKENLFLVSLSELVENKNFVEIGFHHLEYNTIGLIKKNFSGQLIDGGSKINIFIMKFLIYILQKKVKISNIFVTKKNITKTIKQKDIGFLSIDIDGNDFWILKTIIDEGVLPEVIITEYNPSFLNHNISIPYEEFFNRIEKHKSGFYHGASLKAFTNLLKKYDYSLIKCIGGTNAVFLKNSIKENKNITSYEAEEIYQEGELRNKWSKLDANSQFEKIKHLPFEKL